MKPLAIDLFCGLGGWAEGLLSEGWNVVGFDIERHDYGTGGYPGQLVLQDAMTIHGWQFRNADLIVASPPCTEYSYMAMPWSRGKQIARALRGDGDFPEKYTGSRTTAQLNALFDACFRIQREASEAAGRYIPMVVENVRGACPWVGGSTYNFGSFHLWGDMPALMPMRTVAQKFNPDGTNHGTGSWFAIADSKNRGVSVGGDGVKRPGMNWSDRSNPDRMFNDGRKVGVGAGYDRAKRPHLTSPYEQDEAGGDWFSGTTKYGGDFGWDASPMRMHSSKSPARKAATAEIAKIPFTLAQHIAKVYKPEVTQ